MEAKKSKACIPSGTISLDSPTNSNEREAKRPCRSFQSSFGDESEENGSVVGMRLVDDDVARSEAEENVAGRKTDKASSIRAPKKGSPAQQKVKPNLQSQLGEIWTKVEELSQQVAKILKQRKLATKDNEAVPEIVVTEEDREKAMLALNKQRSAENTRREAASAKRTADFMRLFGNILRQITSHKWAWPFMQPVDVEGLGLHDYFDVIKRPMDFGTIREKMDGKDGNGYRTIQEVIEDMRLVFSNAMTYNEVGSDVYVMAKTLSEKFEEKYKAVLEPKIQEEDAKRRQEKQELEGQEAEEMRAAKLAALDRMANELCSQLDELDEELENLKTQATSTCRPMTIEEKRQVGMSLSRLPVVNLRRVIQVIARKNPQFDITTEDVEVDIDALDTGTLWQLHCYIHMVLSQQKTLEQSQGTGVKKKPAK